MRFKHAVITFDGTAQAIKPLTTNGRIRGFTLQMFGSNTNLAFLGGANVSTTSYGVRFELPVGGIPPAPWQLSELFGGGTITFDGLYIFGTAGEKMSLLWVEEDGRV